MSIYLHTFHMKDCVNKILRWVQCMEEQEQADYAVWQEKKEYALSGDDEPCHRRTRLDAEVYELPG